MLRKSRRHRLVYGYISHIACYFKVATSKVCDSTSLVLITMATNTLSNTCIVFCYFFINEYQWTMPIQYPIHHWNPRANWLFNFSWGFLTYHSCACTQFACLMSNHSLINRLLFSITPDPSVINFTILLVKLDERFLKIASIFI